LQLGDVVCVKFVEEEFPARPELGNEQVRNGGGREVKPRIWGDEFVAEQVERRGASEGNKMRVCGTEKRGRCEGQSKVEFAKEGKANERKTETLELRDERRRYAIKKKAMNEGDFNRRRIDQMRDTRQI
jgi:hypothetical protein